MKRGSWSIAASCLLWTSGCKKDHADATTPTEAEVVSKLEQDLLPSGEHLLFLPEGDAKSLLGRAVEVDADGSLQIADSVAPGCRVVAVEDTTVLGYQADS